MTVRGLVDYHLHTSTSRDGRATVAEYCERAPIGASGFTTGLGAEADSLIEDVC
jgi:hypothetical protein